MKHIQDSVQRAFNRLMKRWSPVERIDKITELAESGEVAAHLLDTPFYKRVVSQIEGEMLEQLLSTPAEDVENRERIIAALNINRRYQEFILRIADKGRWAESELRRIYEKEQRE